MVLLFFDCAQLFGIQTIKYSGVSNDKIGSTNQLTFPLDNSTHDIF